MAAGRSSVDLEFGKPLKKKHVMQQLEDMFGGIFDWNVIHSVAQQCDWNIHLSAEKLMVMSEDTSSHGSKKLPGKTISPPGKRLELKNSPNKFAVHKNFKNKKSVNIGEQNNFRPAQGTSRQVYPVTPSPHYEMSGLGAIKVAYQGMHCTADLDDADVVIEEETEFEIVGGNILRRQVVTPLPVHLSSAQPATIKNGSVLKYTSEELNKLKLNSQQRQTTGSVKPNQKQKSGKFKNKKNHTLNSENPVDRISSHIQNGTRILILLRGAPGSGKSHLARHLVKTTVAGHYREYVFSADDYFVRRNGQYIYEPSRLSEAHEWVRKNVEAKMKKGESPVFVDNTNSQLWEMQPYAVLAVNYGYVIELLEPLNSWRYVENKLTEKNIHGVPRQKIRDILQRFERQHTGKSVLALLNLFYHPSKKPPQPVAPKSLAARNVKQIKRERQRKEKENKNNVHTSQVNKSDASNLELQKRNEFKDLLTLYLAKKLQDHGKQLDSKTFNTKLSSGLTVEEMFTTPTGSKPNELNTDLQTQLLLDGWRVPETKGSSPNADSFTGHLQEAANTFGLFGIVSNSSSEDELTEDGSDSDSDLICVEQENTDWEDIDSNQVTLPASSEPPGNEESEDMLHDDLRKFVLVSKAAGSPNKNNLLEGSMAVSDPGHGAHLVKYAYNNFQDNNIVGSDIRQNNANYSKVPGFSIAPIGLLKTQTTASGFQEINASHSCMPEISASQSRISETSATQSGIPEISASHSNMPEMSAPHSGIPGISYTDSLMSKISGTCGAMPGINAFNSGIADTSAINIDVSETNATCISLPEISAPQSEILKISATNSGIPRTSGFVSSVTELSATHSGISEIKATISHAPKTNDTDGSIPEIIDTDSSMPEIIDTDSAMQQISTNNSGIPEINFTHSGIPETSATKIDVSETSATYRSMSEISTPHSGISEISATNSSIPKIYDACSSIPENSAIQSEISEISVTNSAMPEITDTDNAMQEISTNNSGIPETSFTNLSVSEMGITRSSMLENSASDREISEMSATNSVIPKTNDTDSSLLDITATHSGISEISATHSGISEISATHSAISEISATNNTMPEINDTDSTMPEINDTDSTMPEINDSDSTMPDINDSDSTMPEINESDSTMPEINESESTMPEINATDSTMLEINDADSAMPEISTDSSGIPGISATNVDVPEITATNIGFPETSDIHNGMPYISANHSCMSEVSNPFNSIQGIISTNNVFPEISSTNTDVPETTATHSDMKDFTASHICLPKIIATHTGIPDVSIIHSSMGEISATLKYKPDMDTSSSIMPDVGAAVIDASDLQFETSTESVQGSCKKYILIDGVSNVVDIRESKGNDAAVASAIPIEIPASSSAESNSCSSGLLNVNTGLLEYCVTTEEMVSNCKNEYNTNNGLNSSVDKWPTLATIGSHISVELKQTNNAHETCTLSENSMADSISNCDILKSKHQSDSFENIDECNNRNVVNEDLRGHSITNEEMEQWIRQHEQDVSNHNLCCVPQYSGATENRSYNSNKAVTKEDLIDVSLESTTAKCDELKTLQKTTVCGKVNEETMLKFLYLNSAKEVDKCELSTLLSELTGSAVVSNSVHSEEAVVSDQAVSIQATTDNDAGNICAREMSILLNDADTIGSGGATLPLVNVPVKTSNEYSCVLEQQSDVDTSSCVAKEYEKGKEPILLGAAKTEHDDLWHTWKLGTPWEGNDTTPVQTESSMDAGLPKPARRMKRERVLTGTVLRATKHDDPPLLGDFGDWQPVADADVSWQLENRADFTSLDTLLSSEEPLPQREIFADDKSADKRVPKVFDVCGSVYAPQFQERDRNDDCESHHNQEEKILVDASTCTQSTDFWVARLVENNDTSEEMRMLRGMKVLASSGRYISNRMFPDLEHIRNVPSVLVLDKSSMTEDDINCIALADDNVARHNFEQLSKIFSHIPRDQLKELFEKCKGDVNWTAEMLLDSGYEPQDTLQDFDISVSNDVDDGHENKASSAPEGTMAEQFFYNLGTESPTTSTPKSVETRTFTSKKNGRNAFKTQPSAETLELKKHFEKNIRIDSSHYSERVQRIKRYQHGELVETEEVASIPQEPSAPPADALDESEQVSTKAETKLDGTSLGNLKPGDVTVQQPTEEELEAAEPSSDEEQTVWLPMTLERQFVDTLHTMFGNPAMPFPPDLAPVVKIPLSLARQLHCYLMDAQQAHMERQSIEDEELARWLQQEEREEGSQVADLQEIMDMEMALSLYRADLNKSNVETKDDMATRLTKIKLLEVFPEVDGEVLAEVLRAHDYSFRETCEVLEASVASGQEDRVRNVFSPEALAQHEQKLLQQAQLESSKNLQLGDVSKAVDDNLDAKDQALQDANHFRAEATRHAQLRQECDLKAREAYRKKLYTVASYYSTVAELHKRYVDDANVRAASLLLTYHSLTHFTTTLDLHFLQVPEALQVLDIFLDAHVSNLQDSGQLRRTLYVITGRGVHSVGGRARLRPAVIHHLKEKGLRFQQSDNAGMLTVCVTRHTLLSTHP